MARTVLAAARRRSAQAQFPGTRWDDFNRSNSTTALGTPTDGGSGWVVVQGTWGISSNQAYTVTNVDGDRIAFPMGTPNAVATMRAYNTGTGKWAGLFVDDPATGARYLAEVVEATGSVELHRHSAAGVDSRLFASAAGVFTAGSQLSLEQRVGGTATTLTVKVNGSTLTTYADAAATRIQTATRFGIRAGIAPGAASPALRFDDFTLSRTDSDWSAPSTVTTPAEVVALVPELPWAMPSLSAMRAGGKRVGAYVHTLPVYWRNNDPTHYSDYLLPSSLPSMGGEWRQRPLPRINTALTEAQRVQVTLDDLTRAANIGIDFFSVNILTGAITTDTWRMDEHIMPIYTAAEQYTADHPTTPFGVCPDLSMLSIGNNNGSPTTWADAMAPLLSHPAAYKWTDGRPLCFLYNVDDRPASWYTSFASRLQTAHGIDVALLPHHQASTVSSAFQTEYSSLFTSGRFVGLHLWNQPKYTVAPANYHTQARQWVASVGRPYIGSTGPQWEIDRPSSNKELEGKALETIRNAWAAIRLNDDPMMMICSWGDHEESHNVRPSTGYQWVPYDVSAYYIAWYKTGSPPPITRDALFYAHRMHLSTAPYDTSRQTGGPFAISQGPALDRVYTYAFLTAPADVIVTTGGVARTHAAVPAGVTLLDDPFAANSTFTFRAVRAGQSVVPQFASAFPTRSSIVWQDLLYRMGSSTRPPVDGVQSTLPQDRQ